VNWLPWGWDELGPADHLDAAESKARAIIQILSHDEEVERDPGLRTGIAHLAAAVVLHLQLAWLQVRP